MKVQNGSNKWHKRNKRKTLKRAKSWCLVYGLYDPTDPSKEIRYVGQTRSISVRMKWWRKAVDKVNRGGHGSPAEHWAAMVLEKAPDFGITILEPNATWNVSEILWIERLRAQGNQLKNVLRGGEDDLKSARREGGYVSQSRHRPADALELEYLDIMRR